MTGAAEKPTAVGTERPTPRRPYRRPTLEALGDLRGLTLGTSAGVPDSGSGLPNLNQP